MNKRRVLLLLCGLCFIIMGVFLSLFSKGQQIENRLDTIVEQFNERNISSFVDGEEVKVTAKKRDSSHFELNDSKKETIVINVENDVLSSEDYLEEVVALGLIDTVLQQKSKDLSFLAVFNTNTTNDYHFLEDGIEVDKKEDQYRIKMDLNKEITLKETLDATISLEDYQKGNLQDSWEGKVYNRKGSIIYKEETNAFSHKVVTFAASLDTVRESLRQSIANYIEYAKGTEQKEDFLNRVSLESLQTISTISLDNYSLDGEYLAFSTNDDDSYFNSYFQGNYRVVVLILK